MADANELFTVEQSHGKARLTAPRLSDVGSVPTDGELSRDRGERGQFAPGNRAAADRSSKRALTAPLRAARKRLQDLGEALPRPVADELLRDALAVYGSARVELGSSSVFVLANIVSFATESVLAGYFTKQAADSGFETEPGAAYLEQAQRCEQCAQRAMTAALAAAKALSGRRPKRGAAMPAGFEPDDEDA
jgi:hypothetical protein